MGDTPETPRKDSGAPPRMDGAPWRNFYGRRRGKALRPGQEVHLAETLPRLRLARVGWEENPDRTPLDLDAAFGRRGARRVLEIGFGGGEHLLAQALANTEVDFIGCEPFVNGVAMLLPRIAEAGLSNIRLHPGDARDLLDVLPSDSVDEIYLLYPDPWPKKKHHRRRFVNADTLGPMARVLVPGGRLRVATDIPDYARHALEQISRQPDYAWTARRPRDWRAPWDGWVRTRYEAKAIAAGRVPIYLDVTVAE